jgi:hypothetical protein
MGDGLIRLCPQRPTVRQRPVLPQRPSRRGSPVGGAYILHCWISRADGLQESATRAATCPRQLPNIPARGHPPRPCQDANEDSEAGTHDLPGRVQVPMRRPLPAGTLAMLAPWPAAGPTLAFLQLLLGPANAAFSGHMLLGIPTQQMNSLRAKGVMSFQAQSAVVLASSASRKSAGSVCTTSPGTCWLLTGPPAALGGVLGTDSWRESNG